MEKYDCLTNDDVYFLTCLVKQEIENLSQKLEATTEDTQEDAWRREILRRKILATRDTEKRLIFFYEERAVARAF